MHLWDHPKVDRQTPLPVFSHYSDSSHRDVPVPAPWSWDEKKHDFPQVRSRPRHCLALASPSLRPASPLPLTAAASMAV